MEKISRAEAEYLRQNGRAVDVHTSSKNHKGKSKKYYVTTSYKSLKLLREYRESLVKVEGK